MNGRKLGISASESLRGFLRDEWDSNEVSVFPARALACWELVTSLSFLFLPFLCFSRHPSFPGVVGLLESPSKGIQRLREKGSPPPFFHLLHASSFFEFASDLSALPRQSWRKRRSSGSPWPFTLSGSGATRSRATHFVLASYLLFLSFSSPPFFCLFCSVFALPGTQFRLCEFGKIGNIVCRNQGTFSFLYLYRIRHSLSLLCLLSQAHCGTLWMRQQRLPLLPTSLRNLMRFRKKWRRWLPLFSLLSNLVLPPYFPFCQVEGPLALSPDEQLDKWIAAEDLLEAAEKSNKRRKLT